MKRKCLGTRQYARFPIQSYVAKRLTFIIFFKSLVLFFQFQKSKSSFVITFTRANTEIIGDFYKLKLIINVGTITVSFCSICVCLIITKKALAPTFPIKVEKFATLARLANDVSLTAVSIMMISSSHFAGKFTHNDY